METFEKMSETEGVDALLKRTKALIQEGKDFLMSQGKVIDSGNYLTIARYCEKYSIASQSTVTNWIRRGVIPENDVEVIPELNNLRMIRDRIYR